jgi:hypothetical protein
MRRRGFFGGLLALLVAPQAIKADPARTVFHPGLHVGDLVITGRTLDSYKASGIRHWSLKPGKCGACHPPIDPEGPPGRR